MQTRVDHRGTPSETLRQTLAYGAQAARGVAPGDLKALFASLGLSPTLVDLPWANLSGGEAQRASVALSLALRPQVRWTRCFRWVGTTLGRPDTHDKWLLPVLAARLRRGALGRIQRGPFLEFPAKQGLGSVPAHAGLYLPFRSCSLTSRRHTRTLRPRARSRRPSLSTSASVTPPSGSRTT